MRSTGLLLLAGLFGAAAMPLRGQATVAADSARPLPASLTSFGFETQLTVENFLDGGRVGAELGRVWGFGAGRAWRPQLTAALTAFPGNTFLDGFALGPRIAFSRTLPVPLFSGPQERALVLGVTGLVDGDWRFAGLRERRGTSLDPAVRASLGYRFRGPRESSYALLRLLVEGRRHVVGPTFFLSIGFENPRP